MARRALLQRGARGLMRVKQFELTWVELHSLVAHLPLIKALERVANSGLENDAADLGRPARVVAYPNGRESRGSPEIPLPHVASFRAEFNPCGGRRLLLGVRGKRGQPARLVDYGAVPEQPMVLAVCTHCAAD